MFAPDLAVTRRQHLANPPVRTGVTAANDPLLENPGMWNRRPEQPPGPDQPEPHQGAPLPGSANASAGPGAPPPPPPPFRVGPDGRPIPAPTPHRAPAPTPPPVAQPAAPRPANFPAMPPPATAAELVHHAVEATYAQSGSGVPGKLKERAQNSLLESLGTRLYDPSLTEEAMNDLVADHLNTFFAMEAISLEPEAKRILAQEIINDLLRHGPIESYLQDPSVSEVMVLGTKSIYVERKGKLTLTNTRFASETQLRRVIERIVGRVGRRIDESSPMVDARLPDGSRVNAIVPPLAVDGPSLTIRKFTADGFGIDDLIRNRSLTREVAGLLEICVRGRLNILVSGGTGSGKTTLLNILSSFIPHDERIVTIEDAVELRLRQPHVVRLESRPANVEGKGAVTIRDLVKNSLRMRPDRVVVGECRAGETLDMLQAMNTGHDGSLSTLHANNPRDALARVETMVLMAGMDLPVRAIREQVASAVDLIVQIARLRDGSRRVTHVTEIVGMEGEVITMNDIFVLGEYGEMDEQGLFTGVLRPTGIRPLFADKLRDHGYPLPQGLFGETHGIQLGSW